MSYQPASYRSALCKLAHGKPAPRRLDCTRRPLPGLGRIGSALFSVALLLGCAGAQTSATVPNLIKFSGTISGLSSGSAAPGGSVSVLFALYQDQTGGAPLWQEVQTIAVDSKGHYAALLGSSTASGIPVDAFSSNQARWLGVQEQGQSEQPRILLVSVPYALKAADAETLGGLPASAFLRADAPSATANTGTAASTASTAFVNTAAVTSAVRSAAVAAVAVTGTATLGHLPMFSDNSGDVTNSVLFQSGTNVGIGTVTPLANLDIAGYLHAYGSSNPAVNAQGAYLGWNALTGGTGETDLINNQGGGGGGFAFMNTPASGTPRSTLMFLTGGGNLGIGTPAPAFNLHVLSQTDPAAVTVEGYGVVGINFIGRRAEGSMTSPLPLNAGDNIMTMQGRGYGATGFSPSSRAYMKFFAAENWTDTAQGTFLSLATTPVGTVTNTERMRIDNTGNVGIGTTAPANPLSVNGVIQSMAGGFRFPDGTTQTTAGAMKTGEAGYIANGTAVQVANLNISGNATAGSFTGSGAGLTNLSASALLGTVADSSLSLNVALRTASNTFTLPQTINVGTSGNVALTVEADNTGSSPNALIATTASGDNAANAIYAEVTNASSSASAILARTNGAGIPIYGSATNETAAVNAVEGVVASSAGIGVQGFAIAASGNTEGVDGSTASSTGIGVRGYASDPAGATVGLAGQIVSPAGVAVLGNGIAQSCVTTAGVTTCTPVAGGTGGQFLTASGGTVLLGQVVDASFNPTSVFRVDSTGKGYFNGGTQTGGADFAESVRVQGNSAAYSPGDLLTVDPARDRQFALVSEPYSTLVAGIYATKPGILATPHAMNDPRLDSEVPLAIVGIVPCKVSAENGPIHRGDLLVSSSTPGHAMKGTDRNRMLGAVVGKALGSLEQATGVIEVLVTIQ